jgi:peptidoglycan LD-endopeptidase CwlK
VGIWWVMIGLFALVCGGLGMWMFPSWRAWARPERREGSRLAGDRGPDAASATRTHLLVGAGSGQRGWWWFGALALICMPAGLTFWWSGQQTRQLDGFDDTVQPQDQKLSALFEGEHLVPPPPLPPDLFLTEEVVQERPLLASADRRWEQMDPEFVQRVLRVFKVMRDEHGYEMALLEGWRSPERQTLLAAQGAHVTQAGAWQSYHQHGLAVDSAFLRNGKLVISERDPWAMRGYQLYGEVAARMGLTWGGRWKMMDLGHVEWRKPGVKLGAPPPAP